MILGLDVGLIVGTREGFAVGTSDGTFVGRELFMAVGGAVSSWDGVEVGECDSVGYVDNRLLGMTVGESDVCNIRTLSGFEYNCSRLKLSSWATAFCSV